MGAFALAMDTFPPCSVETARLMSTVLVVGGALLWRYCLD